jgi:hypothetical protein
MSLARQTLWTKGTLNCARKMHDRLLEAILRAPMTFFFTTPTGTTRRTRRTRRKH